MTSPLNDAAAAICELLVADAERLRIAVAHRDCGTRVIDCGVEAAGGLQAGLALARVCLADRAQVELAPDSRAPLGWSVVVTTDAPLQACLLAQYAGWEIKAPKFFAMGSGPMRAAAAREPLFAEFAYRETPPHCVGVLESARLPSEEACRNVAEKCGVEPGSLTLLAAPTRSQAGSLQVVARCVETAMHKLHELHFPLDCVVSALGQAPLAPPAADDLASIGRTNDAILYGGAVVICVRCEDSLLAEVGPQVPSSSSRDYGRPFAEILSACGGDFYQIDPLLFSPAQITLCNLNSGRSFRFGNTDLELLRRSFFGDGHHSP